MWHHTHDFRPAPGGRTLMRDTVRYALPLGPLGTLAHRALVRRDLDRIFDFRRSRIALSFIK
jgi:ligand-binding SRPBCC domain-containing protein